MKQFRWKHSFLLMAGTLSILMGCASPVVSPPPRDPVVSTPPLVVPDPVPSAAPGASPGAGSKPGVQKEGHRVIGKPDDIAVLVNKSQRLPSDYRPRDLVEPKIPFIFKEKDEKRLMRADAARALERLFAAAKQDGINLAGVSGYRSYETQAALFAYYVRTQGAEVAAQQSAEPGHSEHQTGLAMDVSGSTGQCAVEECFADTPEGKWVAKHAMEYGFIIRYPRGKEAITGYVYEPWHLRYVGGDVSKAMAAKGLTLEEYLSGSR